MTRPCNESGFQGPRLEGVGAKASPARRKNGSSIIAALWHAPSSRRLGGIAQLSDSRRSSRQRNIARPLWYGVFQPLAFPP